MEKIIFNPIPCGETLPMCNPHAISVSMPTLQDVIDYEERTPEIAQKITRAYPRFVRHPYVKQLSNYIQHKYRVSEAFEVVILSSQRAAEQVRIEKKIDTSLMVDEPFGVIAVRKGTGQLEEVLHFIQITGSILSSRAAQDYLCEIGVLKQRYEEELELENEASEIIKSNLAKAYKQVASNVALSPSGMNAVYTVVKSLVQKQKLHHRDILVQLGWLYSDSMTVIEHSGEKIVRFLDVCDLDELACFLKDNGRFVSAIVTEVPTNPQLKCVDLARLRKLCSTYSIPLIIDSTIATPYLLDFSSYADIVVESLSKFASGNADVLMGAVIINEKSTFAGLCQFVFENVEPVYKGDLQRMAFEIQGYEERIKIISLNAQHLVDYLKSSPYIKEVFYHQFDSVYAGVISVTFNGDFKTIYNALNFAKGPSLGTEFTLLMPYTYLAHYDLIHSLEGKKVLEDINLPIDLLRISVGVEPIHYLIQEFERVFKDL